MERINWSNYDGDKFQAFCNALLSFEVSKKFIPFSAPGKDKGIDGSYEGPYIGRAGKWRFQDKYRQPGTPVSALTQEMKSEMEKVQDDDNFIMLTNLKVSATKRSKLIQEGKDALKRLGKREIFIDVWDEAKIFTLYLRFPILKYWLEEGFANFQLVKYTEAFREQLSNSLDSIYTLSNAFVSRAKELEQLHQFLLDPAKRVAAISGEAGVGKTRLAIEFFQQYIDPFDDWEALSLITRHVDYNKLAFAVQGAKNLVILVDDAHDYDPRTIKDILKLTTCSTHKKVKLIFTVRQVSMHESFAQLSAYDKAAVLDISLDKLSPEETKAAFELSLDEHSVYRLHLNTLVRISHGRPILIVALLRAIREGKNILDTKKEDFFRDYVSGYFKAFVRKIQDKTGLAPDKLEGIVRLVCLLEPFDFTNENLQNEIANKEGLRHDQLRLILKALVADGFASGRWVQSIKPDYYSDVYLSYAEEEWLAEKMITYLRFLPIIIPNLVSSDDNRPARQKASTLLDNTLTSYVQGVRTATQWWEVQRIAETIHEIAYFKPDIGTLFIVLFITELSTPGSVIEQEFATYKNHHLKTPYSGFSAIRAILSELLYHPDQFNFVFDSITTLYQLTGDLGLFRNAFGYDRRETLEGYALERQRKFADRGAEILRVDDGNLHLFFVHCFAELLKLQFQTTETDVDYKAMAIRHHILHSTPEIRKFRNNLREGLEYMFTSSKNREAKAAALHTLLDIPRHILETQHKQYPYDGEEEIKQLLDFLGSAEFTTSEKQAVVEHIDRFRRWGMYPVLGPLLDQLEKQLRPDPFTHKVLEIIWQADRTIDLRIAEADARKAFHSLIGKSPAKKITVAIDTILTKGRQPDTNFGYFLDTLITQYRKKSKTVLDFLTLNRMDLVYGFGARFISALYFSHKESKYIWKKFAFLESLGTPEADNVILHTYSRLNPAQIEQLGEQDIQLLQRLFERRTSETNYHIAGSLITLMKRDLSLFNKLAPEYLATCSNQDMSNFVSFLSWESEEYFDDSSRLLLEHTVRFDISDNLERFLATIIGKKGFREVFQYLTRRFEAALTRWGSLAPGSPYEFVPAPIHSHILQQVVSEEQKIEIYLTCLDWYLDTTLDETGLYLAPQLLGYVLAFNALEPALENAYRGRLNARQNDGSVVLKLVGSLHFFTEKNEALIDLVCQIRQLSMRSFKADHDLCQQIDYQCSLAIGNVGHVIIKGNGQFQGHLMLKKLLEGSLLKYGNEPETKLFLKKNLANLEHLMDHRAAVSGGSW